MAGDPCSAAPSVHIRAVPTVSVADTPAGEALERWLFGPVCDTDKHRAGWDSYFFPRHVGAHVAKPTTLLGFQEEALDRLLTATHREQVDPAMQRYAVSNVARFEWVFARVMQKMCVESRLVTAESLDTPGGAGAPWTTGLLTVATPPPLAGRPCVWGPNAGLCHMQACTCEPACAEPLSETDAPRPRARFIAHWIEDTVLLVVFSKTGGIQITLQVRLPSFFFLQEGPFRSTK